jgi:iron complex transport system ATP-binding protein
MNSISIKGLNVKRRDFDLNIDDLKIDNCNLCLIIGPNGGGKTTILKSLAGLLNYDGNILFNNTDVRSLDFKSRARLFAYLPQNISVPEFRVKDFLITGRLPYTGAFSYYSKEDWDKVAEVCTQVDVTKYIERDLLSLSQGELQRVMLAKVFIQSPKVLLLDEPTNALDIGFKELIKEQVYNYIKTNPEAMVFISTHEPEFFKDRQNKTLLLKSGKLFKFGELDRVYDEQNKKELFNLR